MANKYLLTIMREGGGDEATEVITEDDAKDILASFGAIRYVEGTFVPNFADFFVLRCKMERGEEATFYYDDCVDGTPWVGKIITV